MMSINNQFPMATAAAAPPSLLTQVTMAGTAAVITVRENSDGHLFLK
jgi:hypothetical protein